jgi:hypothetical protein
LRFGEISMENISIFRRGKGKELSKTGKFPSSLVQGDLLVGLTFDFVELRSVRSAPASVPFGVLLFAQKRAKGSFEPACAIAGNKGSSNRAGSWALEKAHRSFLRPPHKAGEPAAQVLHPSCACFANFCSPPTWLSVQ